MFFVRSAQFAVQPFRQLLAALRRWLPFTAVLLALVCVGLIQRSAAVIQNPQTATIVSAASNESDALAPESLATAYGVKLATQSDIATTPQPQLAGTTVEVAGRAASLLFVSPEQVNFLIPAGTPPGLATVTVRAGDGTISTGTTNINAAAPALFTAGGVVSGFALRVNASGAQKYDPVAEFDTANGQFKTIAIDLNSAAGDQVFLVFFLSGLRNADPAQVRVILGGDEFAPVFAGAVPGAPGLDQINLALPRELAGKGVLNLVVRVPNARPSNPARIEIGGGVSTLAVNPLSKQTVVAGETLEIEGTNLPTSNVEVLFEPNVGVAPETLTPTKMTLRVPFGVATGAVKISVNKQIAYVSPQPLNVVTSVSGFVQEFKDNTRVAVAGLPVVMVESSGRRLETVTNSAGAFLIRDAAQSSRSTIQIKGVASNGLGYEVPPFGIRVLGNRDNQTSQEDTTPRVVELKPNGSVATSLTVADTPINETLRVTAGSPNEAAGVITSGQVSFDTNNSTITCPGGASGCQLALNVFDPGRTPTNLPAGVFSSTIVQITPFGATLTPGGKLTFPNSDAIPAGTPVRVYRFDQTPTSATFGQFVDIGAGTISSDGQRLETSANAITQTSYYLISRQWLKATVIGHVVEADGVRPVRRAVVSARGQSTFTDGNGGFVLRNIPVIKANDAVTLEVSSHRADGTVSRTERAGVAISTNAQVTLPTDISLPQTPANLGPTILAPATLSLIEGEDREFNFLVTGLAGAQSTLPTLIDRPLSASLRSLGNEAFALRLAAPQSSAGNYQVTLEATVKNKTSRQTIAVTVVPSSANTPHAKSDAVVTDEDTPINITLASANAGNSPVYAIVAQPLHGRVSGTPPNLRYTPAANYNGTDSFSFRVGSGSDPRAVGAVSIAIRPVNDPPVITSTFSAQSVNAGQTIKLLITATDPDGDQLICTTSNAPAGATQNPIPDNPISPTRWQFNWTPTFTQTGNYSVNFTVTDTGLPQCGSNRASPCSDTKPVTIIVDSKWAKTSGPDGGQIQALFGASGVLYAGTRTDGVYRSANGGKTWAQFNNGMSNNALDVRSMLSVGNNLYAGTTGGVFRLVDGLNWNPINSGLVGDATKVKILLTVSNILYAGTEDGVYQLNENGMVWTQVGDRRFVVTSLQVFGNVLYAGSRREGVYRLPSGTQTWLRLNDGLLGIGISTLLAVSGNLYAAPNGDGSVPLGGIYRLSDNGQRWEIVSNSLRGEYLASLLSVGNMLYAGSNGRVYRLLDNGQGLTVLRDGLPFAIGEIHSLLAFDDHIYAGTNIGVYKLTGNAQDQKWIAMYSGLLASSVQGLLHSGNRLFSVNGGLDGGFGFPDPLSYSSDNGQSWVISNSPRLPAAVKALQVFGNILYAGTENYYEASGYGIYRSTDGGQSWSSVSAGLTEAAQNIRVFLTVGSSLYAGTSQGVFRSTDGQNWMPLSNGLSGNALDVQTFLSVGSSLYAGTLGGVYRSSDAGQNWTSLSNGLQGAGLSVRALQILGSNLYAGTYGGGVYRSTNNGQSWASINSGLLDGDALNVTSLLAVGGHLYVGTYAGGIYRLADNGQSWLSVNTGLVESAYNVNALLAINNDLYAGTDRFVYRSTDNGQSWTPINKTPQNGELLLGDSISVLALLAVGNNLYAGSSGVYRSTDNGRNWITGDIGFPGPTVALTALISTGNILYAGVNSSVYRSIDNGQNWNRVNSGLPSLVAHDVISLGASGSDLYVSFADEVYRSTNNGQNWTKVNDELTVFVFLTVGGNLYAGTNDGVYRVSENGQTWTPLNDGLLNGSVDTLQALGNDLYAGTGNRVYRLPSGSQTWTRLNDGLPTGRIYALLAAGNNLYASIANQGVYRLPSGTQTWVLAGSALPNRSVLALSSDGTRIFAGTEGNGVFLLSDNAQTWTESKTNLPASGRSINAVAVNNSGFFVGTLGNGVYRSSDKGQSWAAVNVGLPLSANVQSIATNNVNLFAGTFGQGVFRSINNGENWIELNSGLPANTGNPLQTPRNINALRANGGTLLAATDGGVFRLGDVVGSWTATNLTRRVLSLLVSGAMVYAGTSDDGIYRSTDDGRSWQAAGKQGLGNLTVLALGVSADGAKLFAGTDAGIYRSDDGGGTWRAVNRDLPSNLVVTSFVTSGAKLYAGSVYGVFLSEDNGENWKQINAGLLDIYVTSFALDGDRLIAGTKVGGVFISQIPDQPACIGIAAQPASKTITSGQTASLSVTPSGNQPFQFQWYQGASGDFSRPITGATANTLTTLPLTATT
ncbi:MAG TPA: Ig-like domain-containing protein, partial [Blastocatellia bacterium]